MILSQVAIDSATPVDDAAAAAGPSGNVVMTNPEPFGYGAPPVRAYGRMYGSLDFDDVSTHVLSLLPLTHMSLCCSYDHLCIILYSLLPLQCDFLCGILSLLDSIYLTFLSMIYTVVLKS